VIVEDVRRDDTYMRVTWHEDVGVFVVSHWRGEVCEAATRISAAAVPQLVNLLVLGLAESGAQPPAPTVDTRRESVLERLRRLLRHPHRTAA
jgi:hypothetical protein